MNKNTFELAFLDDAFQTINSFIPKLLAISLLLYFILGINAAKAETEIVLPDTNKSSNPTFTGVIEIHSPLIQNDQITPSDRTAQLLKHLLTVAQDKDEKLQMLDKACAHYKTNVSKLIIRSMNAINFSIYDRGDLTSSEAADVILGEKLKLKHRPSAECARQDEIDKIDLNVTTGLMELSMELGMPNTQDRVNPGLSRLKELVGEDEANSAQATLSNYSKQFDDSKSPIWDIDQQQAKAEQVIKAAIQDDSVIQDISKNLHKYNHHSKLYRISNRITEGTLGITSLTPTIVGTASQVALFAYIMATGGPEEDKLVSEIYYQKSLYSRTTLINQKTQLALNKYEIALLTHNPVLMLCSQAIIRNMTSEETVANIFRTQELASSSKAIPIKVPAETNVAPSVLAPKQLDDGNAL